MKLQAWEQNLPADYKDREFILSGIKNGFHVLDMGKISQSAEVENYSSATNLNMRARTEAQILTEVENGHYKIVDEKPLIISALGAIPKSDSSKVRLIHDCSQPTGFAVNDFADATTFKYQSIKDAIKLITPNCYMAKLDLQNAYRSVNIHSSNTQATGLKWRFGNNKHFTYMVDTKLPFGAKLSPYIFNTLTQAVRVIMKNRGFKDIIVYLDDFLLVADTYDNCQKALHELMKLVRELGFQINYNKVEGPYQKLTFLGLVLNSINMTITVPDQKITEIHTLLINTLHARKITKRRIQQLVGKLNWITQCVYGGRFHMRRLIDRANSLRSSGHRTYVNKDMKLDIMWWLDFMKVFNGTMQMIDDRMPVSVSIDACKTACGSFFQGDFIHAPWTPQTALLPINYLEVLSLEIATRRWSRAWSNKLVYVHCDNITACAIINKGSCKHPTVMDSLRRIFWLSAIYNFRIRAVYYPGRFNTLADRVSRLHEPNGFSRLIEIMEQSGFSLYR